MVISMSVILGVQNGRLNRILQSLSIVGWVLLMLCVLILLNLRKIIRLRSPLDSQQHREWRDDVSGMHGSRTTAEHLENKDKES